MINLIGKGRAAEICGFSRQNLYGLIERGQFATPDQIINGKTYWTEQTVTAWVNGRKKYLTPRRGHQYVPSRMESVGLSDRAREILAEWSKHYRDEWELIDVAVRYFYAENSEG